MWGSRDKKKGACKANGAVEGGYAALRFACSEGVWLFLQYKDSYPKGHASQAKPVQNDRWANRDSPVVRNAATRLILLWLSAQFCFFMALAALHRSGHLRMVGGVAAFHGKPACIALKGNDGAKL